MGASFGIAPLKDIADCSNGVRPPAAVKAAWETTFADHLNTTEDPILRTTEGQNRDTMEIGNAGGPPALATRDGDMGGHGTMVTGETAGADHLHTTEGPHRDITVMENAGGSPTLAGFAGDLSENRLGWHGG